MQTERTRDIQWWLDGVASTELLWDLHMQATAMQSIDTQIIKSTKPQLTNGTSCIINDVVGVLVAGHESL